MTHDENRISDLIDGGLHDKSAIDIAKYELHMRRIAAIEEAAKNDTGGWYEQQAFIRGAQHVIEHPERYGLVPAAHTAALQERVKELEFGAQVDSDCIESQSNEIDELKAWKESAMKELNALDLQSLGRKLGVGLGQSVSENVHAKIDGLMERVKELEVKNERYRGALERIANEDDEPLSDIGIVEAKWIAKEALKQEE